MKKLFRLTILAPAFLLAWSANVLADETVCAIASPLFSVLPAGTHDDVFVPVGSICFALGNTINGNVKVEGSLSAFGVTVGGNAQCDSCLAIGFDGGTIGGDFQVKGASGSGNGCAPGFFLPPLSVGGNIQFEENSGPVTAFGCTVAGDLQAFKNTGSVTIVGNLILNGNLQCKENSGIISGAGNTVLNGNKEDQCSGF